MCGLVGAWGANPCDAAIKQYDDQASRGSDGFGFLALKNNKIVQFSRSSNEAAIRRSLAVAKEKKPDAILFHHRWPTSTINVAEAAHPLPLIHKKWKYNYYILHNGVITNADSDVRAIESKGYTFASRVSKVSMYRAGSSLYEIEDESEVNDSEVLGYFIAELLEGKRKDIPVYGPIAAIVVQQSKKTGHCRTFVMRNYGNPLQMRRNKDTGSILIASEVEGVPIESGKIHKLTRSLTLTDEMKIDIGKSYVTNTGYSGYYGRDDDRDYDLSPTKTAHSTPVGFNETQKMLEAATVPNVPNRDVVDAREMIQNPALEGEEAVIEKAIEDARHAADMAYSDYQEATAMIDNLDQSLNESERTGMEDYAEELRAIWVQREDDLATLLEDNGREYEYARNRSADSAFA